MRHAVAIVGALVALAMSVRTQDVGSSNVVPIQITGDAGSRFSLVVLGDGYLASEQDKFRAHLDRHLNILWSIEPFRSYRNYFNVYAVEIASQQSGIDCDPEIRERRATALRLQFDGGCTNINARGVTVPPQAESVVQQYAERATPAPSQILIIGNSNTYGGIGGRFATTTGGNALSPLITPHELGHSLGGLFDEYTYIARGKPGGSYDGGEPATVHMTTLSEADMRARQQKWWQWLGQLSESGGRIARFEGGSGYTRDIWRPSRHSMMISLGYYFDQVSRERLTERIAQRTQLIAAATPANAAVGRGDTLWIDTAHPVYHELEITWRVGEAIVTEARNQPFLDLSRLQMPPGLQPITVTVVDATPFVREAAVRANALTATRSWTVTATAAASSGPSAAPTPRLAGSTQTSRPIGASDVVYIEVTHPARAMPMSMPPVTWRLDGRVVPERSNRLSVPLADRSLATGHHSLTVEVGTNPVETRSWTIDATSPTVSYALSTPVASVRTTDGQPHFFFRDELMMKLDPVDESPGYVVAEFRVDGDGWHHYYGWPDAPAGTPFRFTPRGTNIKELIYGSLSTEGLSPQPWERREPGWGTHTIEYRAIDAAGNIGSARSFRVTVMPRLTCTTTIAGERRGDLRVDTGVTCLERASVSGNISVSAGASLIATNSSIKGGVTAAGAAVVELVGSSVGGRVSAAGTAERVTIFGTPIAGVLRVNGTPAAKVSVTSGTF